MKEVKYYTITIKTREEIGTHTQIEKYKTKKGMESRAGALDNRGTEYQVFIEWTDGTHKNISSSYGIPF